MLNDLKSELEAIQTGAAIYPLTDRAFLRITGPDATRWLNGMVTNNIKDLAPGEGNYNFLLNAQGRILGDCTIYRAPDGTAVAFLLETDKSQVDTLQVLLDKFIIMDDVDVQPAPTNETSLLFLGPESPKLLKQYYDSIRGGDHFRLPPLRLAYDNEMPDQITTPVPGLVTKFEIRSTGKNTAALLSGFMNDGVTEVSPGSIEAFRILEARPKYGIDIRNTETAKDLPQETAQTHALSFNKGCYLGQEIVERIHSRGQVHRTFTQFKLTGELPTLPAALTANDKPAGELTSAMDIPGHGLVALGYLRREFATQPVTYPGGTATTTKQLTT
jgi:folate-binding protein YgfZ